MPATWTLPSPARPPLPDLISLVTVLVIRNVASMARNIHSIGRSDAPPALTESPEATKRPAKSASAGTAPTCGDLLVLGTYAASQHRYPGRRDDPDGTGRDVSAGRRRCCS